MFAFCIIKPSVVFYLNATLSLFLPSPSFSLPAAPVFNIEPQAEPSEPSPPKSPRRSPPRTSPTLAPPTPGSPLESKHDVPYFRWLTFLVCLVICRSAFTINFSFNSKFLGSFLFFFCLLFRLEIANETDRLTTLCVHWESKVEDESIPEESECLFSTKGRVTSRYVAVFNLVP